MTIIKTIITNTKIIIIICIIYKETINGINTDSSLQKFNYKTFNNDR